MHKYESDVTAFSCNIWRLILIKSIKSTLMAERTQCVSIFSVLHKRIPLSKCLKFDFDGIHCPVAMMLCPLQWLLFAFATQQRVCTTICLWRSASFSCRFAMFMKMCNLLLKNFIRSSAAVIGERPGCAWYSTLHLRSCHWISFIAAYFNLSITFFMKWIVITIVTWITLQPPSIFSASTPVIFMCIKSCVWY